MVHPEVKLFLDDTEKKQLKAPPGLEAVRRIWGDTSFDSGHFGVDATTTQHAPHQPVTELPQDHPWWCHQYPWAGMHGVRPGCTVCFYGLKKATELNGVLGMVETWDPAIERWVIRLHNGEERYARSENLHILAYPNPYLDYSMQYANSAPYDYDYSEVRSHGHSSWNFDGRQRNGSGSRDESYASRKKTGSFASDTTAATGHTGSFSESSEGGASDEGNCQDLQPRTTVLMRNIPAEYTSDMVVELLNANGFQAKYDLLYVPLDFKTEVALGYALVNLVNEEDAESFKDFFNGFSKWKYEKVCEVTWSDVQGVHKHARAFEKISHAGTVRDKFKPLFFKNGKKATSPPVSQEAKSTSA
jgi:hypothetical protein